MHPLDDFFAAIRDDNRITVTHISIYTALLLHAQAHHDHNPIRVFSRQIMSMAKISAHSTYFRCIRDLNEFGYIRYKPSCRRNLGSQIVLLSKNGEPGKKDTG